MIEPEVSRIRASSKDVKKKRDKASEPEPLVVPMSPEVAAIIHAHLPEPWVRRAVFVGPEANILKSCIREEASDAEMQGEDNS